MKQTGLLIEHRDTDYLSEDTFFGSAPVNPTGDWTLYLPQGEKQHKDYGFDTQSCTTFASLNTIETWMHFLDKKGMLSQAQKEALADFYIDGHFNISDRFTAIMSGTTVIGNTAQRVWDSIRNHGILPEKDLPFGGNNFSEYHDPSVITEEMKAKAKKYLDILVFAYSWSKPEKLVEELKHTPLWSAVYEGSHAVESVKEGKIFDTYEPYLKDWEKVDYLLKPFIYLAEVKKTNLSNFDKAVAVILDNEGGYSHDPKDKGGETKYGISARSFPKLDIKNLTKEQAIEIYRKEYWDKIQGDRLPYPIALQVFDMAVNAGVSPAVKMLQEIAKTYKDGVVGNKTIEASFKIDPFSYFASRIKFYDKAKDNGGYKQGWLNRAIKVYKLIQ